MAFGEQAVAKEIYGDSEAMSLVFAMDDGKFDLQNPGRRLTEHPWNMGEATLVMLAETHAHAELLIAKLEVAIGSGSLKRTLHSNGLTHVESLEAGGWEVIGADMAPKFFPVSQSEDPEERLPALMMAHGTTGRKIGWWVFGIAMFVLAANLVIGFIAVRYSRKMKKADEMRDRILGGELPQCCFYSSSFFPFRSLTCACFHGPKCLTIAFPDGFHHQVPRALCELMPPVC